MGWFEHGADATDAGGPPQPSECRISLPAMPYCRPMTGLVGRGADVNKRFPGGPTAYELAKGYGGGATMQLLLDAGR